MTQFMLIVALVACAVSQDDAEFSLDALSDAVDRGLPFVSATLGDNMVLQRAPQQATVWGSTKPGATVETGFNGKVYSATADENGVWRQILPAMQASLTPYDLTFIGSAGERGALKQVLFGDVFLCGGQSNMVFAIPATTNSTEEAALADNYPHIRIFTVGQNTSSKTPLMDLATVRQPWAIASSSSVVGCPGKFGCFSAVCWFFGRRISDSLGPKVPVGLVSNNWGGTRIESWITAEIFTQCGQTVCPTCNGPLFNSMIHPYTVGPMALTGFAWYQGEQNTRDQASADSYACLFPKMITAWRSMFNVPEAYFGFVQLSTWCNWGEGVPQMREAQMAALPLPYVGYATNADHGAGCNIHPPYKQYVGERLGDSALAIQYRRPLAWKSPSYATAVAAGLGSGGVSDGTATVSVTITLNDVSKSGLEEVYPYNYMGLGRSTCDDLSANGTKLVCAWASVQLSSGEWVNATATAAGHRVSLRAAVPKGATASAVATAYAWGPVPMMNMYDVTTHLPVLPWNRTIKAAVISV